MNRILFSLDIATNCLWYKWNGKWDFIDIPSNKKYKKIYKFLNNRCERQFKDVWIFGE